MEKGFTPLEVKARTSDKGKQLKLLTGFTPLEVKEKTSDKGKKLKLLTGFTLIEILVAIIIFTMVITTVVSLLGSALKNQRQVMAQSEVLNGASYASEYISRALRMAKKDMSGNCIGLKNNFTQPNGQSSVRFLNYDKKCQEFLLRDGAVVVRKSLDDFAANLNTGDAITAGAILVNNLQFDISGHDQLDGLQPKVAFTFQMQSKKLNLKLIQAQTVVSQRDLDVPR